MGNVPRGATPCTEIHVSPRKKRSVSQPNTASLWYEEMQKSEASQELFRACVAGDTKAAMSALVRHANSNVCNAEGFTPLMMAAAGGHLHLVRLLVTSGAKVNIAPSRLNVPALSLAAAQGSAEMVQLLFMWKADPEVGRHSGNAPLSRAAALGHVKVCAMLLEYAANVNAWDNQGVTAAMLATEHEHLETVQLLMRYHALIDVVDLMSRSALNRAVGVLFRQEPWGKSQSGLRNPMSEYECWNEICKQMVEMRAPLDLADAAGETLLSLSVKREREDIMVALLCMRADPDFPVPAHSGGTVLMLAVKQMSVHFCQILLRQSASVNCVDSAGRSALYLAIDKCNEDMCFFLLQSSASHDVVDHETGEPLLMRAAMNGLGRLYEHLSHTMQIVPVAPEGRMHPKAAAVAATMAGAPVDEETAETERVSADDSDDG